jgi:hypothetical protein
MVDMKKAIIYEGESMYRRLKTRLWSISSLTLES